MSPQVVETLTELLRQGKAAADEGRTSDWRDLDWRFHETVVALADNSFLLSSWRAISNLVWLFLHTHAVFERDVPATLANHDKLFAALNSGDPDRAEHAFRSIILGSAFRRFGRPFPAALASLQGTSTSPPKGTGEVSPEALHSGPRIRML
jgi:DNA-binding GntR family transcriptional regulator